MIVYKLTIDSIKCIIKEDASNIVKSINWTYSGVKNGNTCSVSGNQELPEHNLNNFIEFEKINYTILENWLLNLIDIDLFKKGIENELCHTVKVDELVIIPINEII